ncbi:MAG: hypothetical protein QM730_03815 [Anaerolineales bacterium]
MNSSLGNRFSPRAMAAIIQANVKQDRLAGQIGHDEFHFDNNAFDKSYAYTEQQRALTISSLNKKDALAAWSAFGRMTHTAQDFYAHSNYITLWVSRYDGQALPPPPEVDPVDPSLLHSRELHSGKVYLPFELLYFFRPTKAFALRHLPRDSHAWMNLDTPEQGIKFDYAMQAAMKKTVIEFEKTTAGLSEEMCRLFLDT